jgi:hypothetical protein
MDQSFQGTRAMRICALVPAEKAWEWQDSLLSRNDVRFFLRRMERQNRARFNGIFEALYPCMDSSLFSSVESRFLTGTSCIHARQTKTKTNKMCQEQIAAHVMSTGNGRNKRHTNDDGVTGSVKFLFKIMCSRPLLRTTLPQPVSFLLFSQLEGREAKKNWVRAVFFNFFGFL